VAPRWFAQVLNPIQDPSSGEELNPRRRTAALTSHAAVAQEIRLVADLVGQREVARQAENTRTNQFMRQAWAQRTMPRSTQRRPWSSLFVGMKTTALTSGPHAAVANRHGAERGGWHPGPICRRKRAGARDGNPGPRGDAFLGGPKCGSEAQVGFYAFSFLFSVFFSHFSFQIQTSTKFKLCGTLYTGLIIYFDHINCDEVILMITLFVLNNIPSSSLFSRISFWF
jgi:hypothetical protein